MKKIILMLLILELSACGTQKKAEKIVEQEIQSEKVTKQSEVVENVQDYINNSTTISAFQKKGFTHSF